MYFLKENQNVVYQEFFDVTCMYIMIKKYRSVRQPVVWKLIKNNRKVVPLCHFRCTIRHGRKGFAIIMFNDDARLKSVHPINV